MPFHAPTVIAPFAKLIPDMTDILVDAILIVPPINAFPVTPNPPVTVNAPVVVLAELLRFVTANPDTVSKPVDGLITNDEIVDNPKPVPDDVLTVVMENCPFTAVGVTATDEAAEGGTDAQATPEGDAALAVKTKLSAPTPCLINVLPKPTKISPLV